MRRFISIIAILGMLFVAACGDDDSSKPEMSVWTDCSEGEYNRQLSDGDVVEFCPNCCTISFAMEGATKYTFIFNPYNEDHQTDWGRGELPNYGYIYQLSESGEMTFTFKDANGRGIGRIHLTFEEADDCEECEEEEEEVSTAIDGSWDVERYVEWYCECNEGDPLEECCASYEYPGSDDDCEYSLRGHFFLEPLMLSPNSGFMNGFMKIIPLCDPNASSTNVVFGEYHYTPEENRLLIHELLEDQVMEMNVLIEEDGMTLFFGADMGDVVIPIMELNLVRPEGDAMCRSSSEEMGRCFSRADCSGGPLLGCCSKEACETALAQLHISGSWRPLDGDEEDCVNF